MKKAKVFKKDLGGGGKKFSNAKPRLYQTQNWVEYRNKFLAVNPKCYACGERAVVVDHIVSHKGDEKLFWDETNFIPLCKKCHDTITGLFDRHVVANVEGKLKWINAKRLETNTATKVRVVTTKIVQ
jgi:5-methylcytosine-specific restriction endonuclease McrA